MLAAILLNLADYQQPARDADAGKVRYYEYERKDRRKEMFDAAAELEVLLDAAPKVAKPIKKLLDKAKRYADNALSVEDQSNFYAELAARAFEIRQEMERRVDDQIQYLIVLEQITVFLTYLREDEDDLLVLLLGG